MGQRQFIVQIDGTYYVTTGRVLVYDRKAAQGDEQAKGVEEVAARFAAAKESGTYEAVVLDDESFSAVHSSDS